MPFMAKQGNNYEEVETLVDTEGREIDYVLSKVGNTYKRTFTKVRELEDAPPLEFKSIKPQANLLDYRIYGNTVNGESVGDRTGNLFDGIFLQGFWLGSDGSFQASSKWICTQKMPCKANTDYTFTFGIKSRWYGFAWYDIDGNYIESNGSTIERQSNIFTAISPANAAFMVVNIAGDHIGTAPLDIHPSDVTDFMLVEGSTPLPYEPYGYRVPVKVEGKNLFDLNTWDNTIQSINGDGVMSISGSTVSITSVNAADCYTEPYANSQTGVYKMPVKPNTTYTVNWYGSNYRIMIFENGIFDYMYNFFSDSPQSFTTHSDTTFLTMRFGVKPTNPVGTTATISEFIISEGSEATPYEPYQTPVTTNLYLPEQIRKVGDEAEYIDYGEQKMHRIGADDINVTLPALPTVTETNVLSVGTEVQPSEMYIKGNIKGGGAA